MKKVLGLFSVLFLTIILAGATKTYAASNMLINGGGENGMNGWFEDKDSVDVWMPSTRNTSHTPKEGDTFFWPSNKTCAYACMYQDVNVSKLKAGTWLELSAWLANFDQSPHDQATLKVEIYNKSNKLLYSDYSLQRNPEWQKHILDFALPKNASYVRVLCIAERFVGNDNDAYFDDIILINTSKSISPVVVTGDKDSGKPGDTIQLAASDGKYKMASDYIWSSSYDNIATVDKNGLVTMVEDCDSSLIGAEVWIYAKNKKTGIVGKYYINSKRKNSKAEVKPDKVTDLSAVAVKLTWKKSKNATGYYIYRLKNNGKYEKIQTINKASTTSYLASKLALGNTYKFKVVAFSKKNGKITQAEASKEITVSLK